MVTVKERRQQERVQEGRRPWSVFDAWGSFGGIDENTLRGRILSILWLTVFITSLPGFFFLNYHAGTLLSLRTSLFVATGLLVLLGPGVRIWYADWHDLQRKWLGVPYGYWMHIALIGLVFEITALGVVANTLEFRFTYLFVLGYVAYFYDLRTALSYVALCLVGLAAPIILNSPGPSMSGIVFVNSSFAGVLVTLLIYWQQHRLRNNNQRLRTLNKLIRELSDAFTPAEKHQVFIRNMREVFQPRAQIIWANLLTEPRGTTGLNDEAEAQGDTPTSLGNAGVILDAVPEATRINLMQGIGERHLRRRLPWALLLKRPRVLARGMGARGAEPRGSQKPKSRAQGVGMLVQPGDTLGRVLEQMQCTQVLSIPVQMHEDRPALGLAWLGDETELGFTQEDFVYYQACVREYAHSLEVYNAELSKVRAADELHRARQVADILQENLLPRGEYATPSLTVGYTSHSATTRASVGGDFYDFLTGPPEKPGLGIVIGDTIGHGLEAAKLTALIKYTLRTLVELGYPLERLLGEANHVVNRQAAELARPRPGDAAVPLATLFTTVQYAYYDEEDFTLHVTNSGHHAPVVYHEKAGAVQPPPGFHKPPLGAYEEGVAAGTAERVTQVQLPPGSLVCFYTDGVVEARNAAREEFGINGIRGALGDLSARSPQAISKEILRRVRRFANNNLQDDATVIVIKTNDSSRSQELTVREHLRLDNTQDKAAVREFHQQTLREYLSAQERAAAVTTATPDLGGVERIVFEFNLFSGHHQVTTE